MHLTVLTVAELTRGAQSLERSARESLASRNVAADYVHGRGSVASAVLKVASERQTDLLLMGGYGHGAALNFVLGSATLQVLKRTEVPVLVCQ